MKDYDIEKLLAKIHKMKEEAGIISVDSPNRKKHIFKKEKENQKK